MNRRARRIIVPLLVLGIAVGILAAIIFGRGKPAPSQAPSPPDPPAVAQSEQDSPAQVEPAAAAPQETASLPERESAEQIASDESAEPADSEQPEALALTGLRAMAPRESDSDQLESVGSLHPEVAPLEIHFSTYGAGMSEIVFSDIWVTSDAKRQAANHYAAIRARKPNPPPLPPDEERHRLNAIQNLTWMSDGQVISRAVPVLAAHSVLIGSPTIADDPQRVSLLGSSLWSEVAPGSFQSLIVDEDGDAVMRITRAFILGDHGDISLNQTFENLSAAPFEFSWVQYGPGDLAVDRANYLDRRRYRIGYVYEKQPEIVIAQDNEMLFERQSVMRTAGRAVNEPDPQRRLEMVSFWPNRHSEERALALSWFSSTNRYFTISIHPEVQAVTRGIKTLSDTIERITFMTSGTGDAETVFTNMTSPPHRAEPGTPVTLNLGVYAGPLDRHILNNYEPYKSLNMGGLILYQMSSWCAICTFQWLAVILLNFLAVLESYVVFDWGVAIICLVIVVRILLHPLMKKGQISMHRFGSQMRAMQPELEKIKKKYAGDPKKLQQEQMRLMREHRISPSGCLGFLPMFLQTPIWIALYAMLYFAFDLRQESAFFGIFQMIGNWPFLADLSSGDHFFGEFAEPTRFFLWNITGLNLLPILMGMMFYLQQKYMTPPPTPGMSEDQIRAQKMMRILFPIMFPVMLYSAPSGLTLYIFTSSSFAILEGRYIRAHIKEMEESPDKQVTGPPGAKKKKKPRDAQGRAYAAAIERMRSRNKPKAKSFKKRK